MSMNVPMPYHGTADDLEVNRGTHDFDPDDDDRCPRCGSRPHHVSAAWPCGVEPPRVDMPDRGADR